MSKIQKAPTAKIVQISYIGILNDSFDYLAVCEDGSVWLIEHKGDCPNYLPVIEPFNGTQYAYKQN